MTNFVGKILGPKYDGKYLSSLLHEILGDLILKQTLATVVIPAFDIKQLQPVIFTTDDAKLNEEENPKLMDVCIGTSAAPTYLPAHQFETKKSNGETRIFNLIDGGVAANNPTLAAMSHIAKEISVMENTDYIKIKPMKSQKMLVLSLGTGTPENDEKYNAVQSSKWGVFNWVYEFGANPIIDIFSHASANMVDYHVSTLFQAKESKQNYLRIQDDKLTGNVCSVDIATEKNLTELEKTGERLLKKPVSRVNLKTGKFEEVEGDGSNEDALTIFAERLSKERGLRVNS